MRTGGIGFILRRGYGMSTGLEANAFAAAVHSTHSYRYSVGSINAG